MKKFLRGETVTIEDEFKVSGELTTPDTSYTCEIDDPFKENIVDADSDEGDMTVVSTGILRFNWDIPDNAKLGVYKADCIYVHNGVTRKSRHLFEVVKEVD